MQSWIRWWIIMLLGISLIPVTGAGEFKVSDVIHPSVARAAVPPLHLPEPKIFAISSAVPEARAHVKQGITAFNSPWDFEAYRHFATAARLDPDCLMAYWGIVMSLAGNHTEFYPQRGRAVHRLLDLVEADPPIAVDIEKAYAIAAARLVSEGTAAAGQEYLRIAERYPADIQSRLLGSLLMRDGYDQANQPKVHQKKVNRSLRELVDRHPDQLGVLSFWLTNLAEAPPGAINLKVDALPVARRLAREKANYPPFALTAAHIEARCGNAKAAISYASEAVRLYEDYMKKDKVGLYDCEGWVRAQVYLAHLYVSKGEFTKALPIVRALATYKIDSHRLQSRGAAVLLWEGRSLPARLYASRNKKEDFDAALKLLDSHDKDQWFLRDSLIAPYRDGLALYLGARKALLAKDHAAVKGLLAQLAEKGKDLAATRPLARLTSSYSEWYRAATNLSVLSDELRGLLAEQSTGAMKLAAVNWYQSASEQQILPANLLPPCLPYPMEWRLGSYYLNEGDTTKALQTFNEGLQRRPNHLDSLRGYREAFARSGRHKEAKQVDEMIERVLR